MVGFRMSTKRQARILIVDDEKLIRWSLRQRLEESGHTVVEAANGQEALQRYEEGVDLVLLDWLLPDENGLEVFRRMRAADPTPPVIMLTAHTSVPRAVEVMKEGIFHYAGKPFDLDEVMRTVRAALETSAQRFAISTIRGQVNLDHMIGDSAIMQDLKSRLQRIAKSSAQVVLIRGERGTGKTLIARALHGSSPRADGPIHTIPCNQVPEDELETELFGEGSSRGLLERCDGGTLVIDDFADIPPGVQARLLRYLEDRRFRRVNGGGDRSAQVRLVFTTSADLSSAVGRKVLRDDLFRKISLLSAELPPLRHRDGDIPLLTRAFIEHFNAQFERDVRGPTGEALQLLESNPWLGNVRELHDTVERAVLLCENNLLEADAFELNGAGGTSTGASSLFQLPPTGVDLQELERRLLIQALERAKGNRTRAGQLLGMNRDQVRYRIEKFNLEEKKASSPARRK